MTPRYGPDLRSRFGSLSRVRLMLAVVTSVVCGVALGAAVGAESNGATRAAAALQLTAVGPLPAADQHGLGRPAAVAQTGRAVPLMLPRLEYVGAVQPAEPWVSVTNVGAVAGQPILVVFGDDDPSGCGGPLMSECGGLTMPGSTWHFLGAQIPTGSASGVVYSLSADTTVARTPEGEPLGPSTFGAVLCEGVFYGAVGSCDRYRDFHAAYLAGGSWMGIDLGQAAGPPMVASVLRTWSVDLTPGAVSASAYRGIASDTLEADRDGTFRTWVIERQAGGLAVQNAGSEPAMVRVFESTDAGPAQCAEAALEVGRAAAFDLSETCLSANSERLSERLIVESDQPVATLVDGMRDGMLTTETGFLPMPDQAPATQLAAPVLLPGAGNAVTVTVTVLNLGDEGATVDAVLHDAAGQAIDSVADAACPGCVRRLTLGRTAVPGRAASAGFVRLTSSTPGANLRGSIEVEEGPSGTVQRSGTIELGPMAGAGHWVVPVAPDATESIGLRSELAITNYSDAVRADVRVWATDRNDTENIRCLSLGPNESARIDATDLDLQGKLTTYVVELVDQSPEPGPGGTPGIGVTAAWLFNTTRERDIPGDELALMAGVPLADAIPVPGPVAPDCAPDFDPARRSNPDPALERAANGVVFTPQTLFLHQLEQCVAHLSFTNDGDEPIRVLSVQWGEAGFCPPQCAGPLAVDAVGPIEPGQTITRTVAISGVQSAVHYGLADISAGDAGVDPGSFRPLAEVLRERVGQAVLGDCDDIARFHRAYLLAESFHQMPLGQVHGGQLGVTVTRECPDVETPELTEPSSYPGISGVGLDATRETGGAWVTSVVPIEDTPGEDLSTMLHVQNAGDLCAAVTIEYIPHGFGAGWSCPIFAVAPGETFPMDVSWCVPSGFRGYAVLTSTEPLAVVVEITEPGRRRAARGWPTRNPFDLNGDGEVNQADGALLGVALGSEPGDPNWDPRYDLNADGGIDVLDLALLRENYDADLLPTPSPTTVPTRHPTQTATPTPMPTGTATRMPTPPITDTPSPESPGVVFLPYAEVPPR